MKKLGKSAFSGCWNLSYAVIPDGLSAIMEKTFAACGLISLQIPASVTVIGEASFSGCDELVEISLPDTLREINSEAFNNCESLATLYIPSNVNKIGRAAFSGCKLLTLVVNEGSYAEKYCKEKGLYFKYPGMDDDWLTQ